MKKHSYSLFSVLALTLLIASCTTENELITPIKQSITAEDYNAALIAADTAIANDPTNGQAYYYKAYTYSRLAADEPVPADRQPLMANMRENVLKARDLFDAMEEPPYEAEQIHDLIMESWSREHNTAIGYATNDSVMATVENPIELSITHLKNALTINPDSSLSYDVLSQVYQMNGDYENAAKTLEMAIEKRGGVGDAYDYDRMASYYFMLEDYQTALGFIEEGLENYPDSVSLIQKVADAYFQTGQTDKALETVNELIQRDPTNSQYHLVVGTQIYQRVQLLTEEMETNSDRIYDIRNDDALADERAELIQKNAELLAETDQLITRAETALLKASELNPENPVTFKTLGILHQNKAAALYDQRNATDDLDEASELDQMARSEVEKAMGYYESAAELTPDDQGIWQSLFEIYTLLDYREKAEAAMEKAGM